MKKKLAAVLCLLLVMLVVSAAAERAGFFPTEGYSVILEYNDGVSRAHVIHCAAGESIAQPAEPVRRGCSFSLWLNERGEEVTFPYTPDRDVTLTAQWIPAQMTVTLEGGYEGAQAQSVVADYNSAIEAPDAPNRKDYIFRHWSLNPDGETPAEFPMTVTSDVTLYAVWLAADVQVYTVTYEPGFEGAKAIKPVEVTKGKGIKKFPKAKRDGYVLEGWSLTEDGPVIKAPFIPEESCTLYAIWSTQEYTVNFNANYKGAPDDGKFERIKAPGATILDAPEKAPERENYTFMGWYTSAEGGNPINFPVEVTRSTTYYAHWEHLPVATTIFDAEFTAFDPLEEFPGYSGEALGKQVIQTDASGSFQASTQYGDGMTGPAYYVSYMYKQGATITFVIQSDKEVTGASLYARLASESDTNKDLVIATEGDYGYQFIVNGTPLAYEPLNVGHTGEAFREVLISSDVTLHAGENEIRLVTDNITPMGGTMKASAPTVDCIRLDGLGGAQLTWSPVYDNIQ